MHRTSALSTSRASCTAPRPESRAPSGLQPAPPGCMAACAACRRDQARSGEDPGQAQAQELM
jgi:hypothetical protein